MRISENSSTGKTTKGGGLERAFIWRVGLALEITTARGSVDPRVVDEVGMRLVAIGSISNRAFFKGRVLASFSSV